MSSNRLPAFNEDQVLRYSRHIILPSIGGAGQRKLLDAKVLCVGAGGLGSPIAMYLAAAGVGTLGVLDFDRVDKTKRTSAGRRSPPRSTACAASTPRSTWSRTTSC
jgi:shikimate 5-dehydrogenase